MKRIIVWVTIVTLILAGVFAMNACQKTDENGVKYELNFDNFDGVTAYGEPMISAVLRLPEPKMESPQR